MAFYSLAKKILEKFPKGTKKTPEEWRKILQNKQVKRAELDYVGALSENRKWNMERDGEDYRVFAAGDGNTAIGAYFSDKKDAEEHLMSLRSKEPGDDPVKSWRWDTTEPVAVEDMIRSFDTDSPVSRNLKVESRRYEKGSFDEDEAREKARERVYESDAYADAVDESRREWLDGAMRSSVDEIEDEDEAGDAITRYRAFVAGSGYGSGGRYMQRRLDELNENSADEIFDTYEEADLRSDELLEEFKEDSRLQEIAMDYSDFDDSELVEDELRSMREEGELGDVNFADYTISEDPENVGYYEETLHDVRNREKWQSPHSWPEKENVFAHQRGLAEAEFADKPGRWSLTEERQAEPVNLALRSAEAFKERRDRLHGIDPDKMKGLRFSGWEDDKAKDMRLALRELEDEETAKAGNSLSDAFGYFQPMADRDGDWKVWRVTPRRADVDMAQVRADMHARNSINAQIAGLRMTQPDDRGPELDAWRDEVSALEHKSDELMNRITDVVDHEGVGRYADTPDKAMDGVIANYGTPITNLFDASPEDLVDYPRMLAAATNAKHLAGMRAQKGVPVTPWRENYHEQLLRKQLMDMAESGEDFKGLAWTTGQTQANRWRAENHIKGFNVVKGEDGKYAVEATLADSDQKVKLGDGFTQDTLANKLRLGGVKWDKAKEVAAQMTAQADTMPVGAPAWLDTRNIEGLVTGAEGYTKGYDDLSLAEARKIGKPFGVEPEEADYMGKSVWRMETPPALLQKVKEEGFPLWTVPPVGAGILAGALYTGEGNEAEAASPNVLKAIKAERLALREGGPLQGPVPARTFGPPAGQPKVNRALNSIESGKQTPQEVLDWLWGDRKRLLDEYELRYGEQLPRTQAETPALNTGRVAGIEKMIETVEQDYPTGALQSGDATRRLQGGAGVLAGAAGAGSLAASDDSEAGPALREVVSALRKSRLAGAGGDAGERAFRATDVGDDPLVLRRWDPKPQINEFLQTNYPEDPDKALVGFNELRPGQQSAAAFRKAIVAAKAEMPEKAWRVMTKDLADYQKKGARLFLSDDQKAGFAVMPDGDLVSLFSSPTGAQRNVARSAIALGTQHGATKMDNFESLTPLYEDAGARPTARLRFDDENAPEDWRGSYPREDIDFMAIDPDVEPIKPGYVPSWDEGERARGLTLKRIESGLDPDVFRQMNDYDFLRREVPSPEDVDEFTEEYENMTFTLPMQKPAGFQDDAYEEYRDLAGKRAIGDPEGAWSVMQLSPPLDNKDEAYLSLLETPREHRGKGLASAGMDKLTELSDDYGVPLSLTPVALASRGEIKAGQGLDQLQLEEFYRSKGFEDAGVQFTRGARLPRSAGAAAGGAVGLGALALGSEDAEAMSHAPDPRYAPVRGNAGDTLGALWSNVSGAPADMAGMALSGLSQDVPLRLGSAGRGYQPPAAPSMDLPYGSEDLRRRLGVDPESPFSTVGDLLSFGVPLPAGKVGPVSKITRKPLALLEYSR